MRFIHAGIMAMGSVATAIGIARWTNLFQSYFDNIDPHLFDVILVVLIGSTILTWFYSHKTKKPTESDVKTHLDNLNMVYQKLARMKLLEINDDYEWVRKVPAMLDSDELEYVDSVRDLKRALKHLQQSKQYDNVFKTWNKLELSLCEYNVSIPTFIEFLKNYIRETMAKKTNYAELDGYDEGYFLLIMRRAVMFLIDEDLMGGLGQHMPELKIEGGIIQFDCNKFTEMIFVIGNNRPEKIKDDLTKLLLGFVHDKTVLEKYNPYLEMRSDMFQAQNEFEQAIEPLIHDIQNNGLLLDGRCDLGY